MIEITQIITQDFDTPLQELKDTTNDLLQCVSPRDIK